MISSQTLEGELDIEGECVSIPKGTCFNYLGYSEKKIELNTSLTVKLLN